jgi:hypothetical protein
LLMKISENTLEVARHLTNKKLIFPLLWLPNKLKKKRHRNSQATCCREGSRLRWKRKKRRPVANEDPAAEPQGEGVLGGQLPTGVCSKQRNSSKRKLKLQQKRRRSRKHLMKQNVNSLRGKHFVTRRGALRRRKQPRPRRELKRTMSEKH